MEILEFARAARVFILAPHKVQAQSRQIDIFASAAGSRPAN
jgi:hypothetical protein